VDVQGRLVEVLSGMSFGEYLQQKIFAPLEMDDTFFIVPDNKMERLATLYSPEGASAGPNMVWQRSASKQLVPADQSADRSFRSAERFESGGGGLISTADDYMRFCLMLLNGGEFNGRRLLSPRTVELMTMDHMAGLPSSWGQPGRGFGLGFAVVLDPALTGELGSAGEYSWGGAAGTRFWIDPEEEMVGIFMVQSLPHQTELASKFRLLTYQAIVE
jgi:CubicO group peptidase (beta-lactamase class C family)